MKITIYNIAIAFIILSITACAASQSTFKVGKQYYDEGNFEQAIIELEKSSVHDTSINDRINAFEYLGDAYTRKGNLDRAVLSYKNAYKLIRVRIGELIDIRKTLKSGSRDTDFDKYKAEGKTKKLSDELSNLTRRSQEMQVKINHLK